jgi:hypothetical protein
MERLSIIIAGISLLLLTAIPAHAQDDRVGTVVSLEGQVELLVGEWTQPKLGDAIHRSNELRTGANGKVSVVLTDESVFNLGPNSHVNVEDYVLEPEAPASNAVLNLLKGKVRALVSEHFKNQGASFNVKTATATAGVRGTEFVVAFSGDQTDIAVIEGKVAVRGLFSDADAEVIVLAGQRTTVRRGASPTRPVKMSEEEQQEVLRDVTTVSAVERGSAAPSPEISTGQEVDPAERITDSGSRPVLQAEPSGPPVVVLFEDDTPPSPTDSFEQPAAAVSGFGQVDVPF